MRRNDRFREAGYSLIEVILILVLMGVLAIIAAPRFVYSRAGPAARQVASDIRYAKELAIRRQTMCGVYVIDGTSYRVFQDDNTSQAARDPVTGGDFVVTLSGSFSGVTLSSNFGDTLKFDALGTPLDGSNNPLTSPPAKEITISSGSETRTVTIEPNTGKVSVS